MAKGARERESAIYTPKQQHNRLQVYTTTRKIQQEVEEIRRQEEEGRTVARSRQALTSPIHKADTHSLEESRNRVSPTRGSIPTPGNERAGDESIGRDQGTPARSWRTLVSSVTGYLSPWGRRPVAVPATTGPVAGTKRFADDVDETPTVKRIRQFSPKKDDATAMGNLKSRIQGDTSSLGVNAHPGPDRFTTPKPSRAEVRPATTSRKRRNPSDHVQPTREQHAREHVSLSTRPSEPQASLSTINEWTDTSSAAPGNTPSKPRQRRSIFQVRAARAASVSTPISSRTPRRAPMTADRRLEKLRHYAELQKELEEMRGDADLVEMQQHRRKRVKVDDLAAIPHNLPGDADGTFRVPEIDSDSEIEVDEAEPLRSNIFDRDASAGQVSKASGNESQILFGSKDAAQNDASSIAAQSAPQAAAIKATARKANDTSSQLSGRFTASTTRDYKPAMANSNVERKPTGSAPAKQWGFPELGGFTGPEYAESELAVHAPLFSAEFQRWTALVGSASA